MTILGIRNILTSLTLESRLCEAVDQYNLALAAAPGGSLTPTLLANRWGGGWLVVVWVEVWVEVWRCSGVDVWGLHVLDVRGWIFGLKCKL